MASSKDFLAFVLDQLSGLEGISHRAMMGEYILYYRGKVIGGIYDDRLLVKNIPSAAAVMTDVKLAIPYEGAKQMLLVEEIDNRELLENLFNQLYDALPNPHPRKNN